MNWHRPVWYEWDHWRESHIELRIEDMPDSDSMRGIPPEWLAANWGIPLDAPDLESQVRAEWHRRLPCVECGCVSPARTDIDWCDPCLMRVTVRWLRDREEQRERYALERQQRRAAAAAFDHLPPGRQQMVSLSGIALSSPDTVFSEAYGEW